MGMINKQQLCAELGVSESTVRRLEQQGLPYVPVGSRSHRYDLEECKTWLQSNPPSRNAPMNVVSPSRELLAQTRKFEEACRKVKLRVYPSK